MNNHIVFYSKFLIIFCGLLVSCTSADLIKRKYNGGFYFGHSGKVKAKENKKPEQNQNDQYLLISSVSSVVPLTGNNSLKNEENNIVQEVIVQTIETPKAEKNKIRYDNHKEEKPSASYRKTIIFQEKNYFEPKKNESKNDLIKKNHSYDEDTMNVLILVLCLILPPLAIYLKGNKTNVWFWLTLILCLFSSGVFFGVGAMGTGWFIAFILALLYVLDILK
jgi:uncharacterized membrane protein YqaE (UPF0057 family)